MLTDQVDEENKEDSSEVEDSSSSDESVDDENEDELYANLLAAQSGSAK
jgi:hypothetical protein